VAITPGRWQRELGRAWDHPGVLGTTSRAPRPGRQRPRQPRHARSSHLHRRRARSPDSPWSRSC